MSKPKVIAFYLPQYHPIPENDQWWGKGFTEWTNVGKAKPLFKGHYQPKVPADLGYYDLRMPEVREAQAELAKEAGIEGFCYWHYWFGNGKKILDYPFNEVLKSGKPDFPFCLGWANHDWTNKTWEGVSKKIKEQTLLKMKYNTIEYEKHFYDILPALKDKRYLTIDNKPIFLVFRPLDIPYPKEFIDFWQKLAKKNGLNGIFFIGIQHNMLPSERTIKNFFTKKAPDKSKELYDQIINAGFDAVNSRGYNRADYFTISFWKMLKNKLSVFFFNKKLLSICEQKHINKYLYVDEDKRNDVFPTLIPNWDRTPRSGRMARIYHHSTPKVFDEQISFVKNLIKNKQDDRKILFLMSWNEWGEGNYVEPDLKYGKMYLNVLKKHFTNPTCKDED